MAALLSGCISAHSGNDSGQGTAARELTISKNAENKNRKECMPTIDYVDALMLNDIRYYNRQSYDERSLPLSPELIGDEIAEVAYTMSDDACTDFVMRSGDATFVPAGTPIHEMKDYDPDFRVVAEGRIFEVGDNPHAKTIGDLYDIEGKVSKVNRVSGNDGSVMREFSPEDTEAFISDLLSLEYVGFDAIDKDNPPEYRISLRVDLKDGTNIRLGYWPKANAIMEGAYGTERMLEIVQKEP
ncbi:hypothetical protein SAEN111111_12390 [Saccharibacillus endophyticus]